MIKKLDIKLESLEDFKLLDVLEFIKRVTEDSVKGSVHILSIRLNGYKNRPYTMTFEELPYE